MFRQGLRRAALLRTSGFRSTIPNISIAARASEQPCSALLCPINGVHRAIISRLYSSESTASAVAEQNNGGIISSPTRFDELHTLGVHENLVRTITRGMGYVDMTDVQAKTIKPTLEGVDIVAQAKTGTGKTLAFLIPVLQRMLAEDPTLADRRARRMARCDDVRGIIISPTRELAEQIAVEAEKLVANTGLVVQRAVGGSQKSAMLRKAQSQGCHLLVATPGRLNDLLQDPYSGIRAPNLAAIVLDEADRMLDVGFEQELASIVSNLPDPEKKPRQTLLFSATIPQNVVQLARNWVRRDNFDFIQTIAPDDDLTHEKVAQHMVPCRGWGNVLPALYELIEMEIDKRKNNPELLPFKAIVYFPSTAWVDLAGDVDREMRYRQRDVRGFRIHSKLTQLGRTKAADSFRQAESAILFSSDVTARGLDFPNVTHVIQIGAPTSRDQYIHRVGRTGRQNKDGEGWLFLPNSSISFARKELAGLPIKPNASLTSAQHDMSRPGPDMPAILNKVNEAATRISRSQLNTAYMSLWGTTTQPQALADELHEWFIHGLGMEETPPISPKIAGRRGLAGIRNLNIRREAPRAFRDGGPRSFGRDRMEGDWRGRSSRQAGFRGADKTPFDRMNDLASNRQRGSRSSRPEYQRATF